MVDSELGNKVQTVLGLIEADRLGVTLTHEHFLLDMPIWFREPSASSEKLIAYQPVSLENLGWIRYHPCSNLDNLRFLDEEVAISEGLRYRYAGGNSVVEVTSIGLGRDPLGLARISRATGLHIVMGTGYYLEQPIKTVMAPNLTEEIMTEEIVREITVGVKDTGIRAGIIGEVGIEWPMQDRDKMSLRATANAQKETGAPVSIHPGRSPNSPFEILDVLSGAGADISRVVMSHVDRTLFVHETRVRLAKMGCFLGYDQFSNEGWSPLRMVISEDNPQKADLPNDAERINQIMALIDEGFLNQILISQDVCHKHTLWRYGGPGYAHILQNVIPLMREKGMTEEEIRCILVENPKRLLRFT